MALGERLNLEFQHACYCNVASHYGSGDDFSPAGKRGVPLAKGLGSIALSPFFSVGSPQDGSTFPAPSLKLLTLRAATLPGYKVGQIEIKGREGANVSAADCGMSALGRAHGNYLPSCIPLRRGGEGRFLETDGSKVVNMAGAMVDFNSADLYTPVVPGTPDHKDNGLKIKGLTENSLGPSFCDAKCLLKPTPACPSTTNTSSGAMKLCDEGDRCLMQGNDLAIGPGTGNRWHGPQQIPFGPLPSRILGKGWADRAQDNPKIYGQSEIYWNWTKLGTATIRATSSQENPNWCKQYRAGTLTVGLGSGSDLKPSYSWRDNLVRPLAGAPIRFQTIPFLYESTERAYNSKAATSAAEKPHIPLYKNGYFHSLISDPVFYRYRAGPLHYENDPPFVYDDSCKDSQQNWLPHHKTNIVLKAVDPQFNWIDTVPKEPLRASSQTLICSQNYLGPWCDSYNASGGPPRYHQYWAKNAEGGLSPTCYIADKCEVPDPDIPGKAHTPPRCSPWEKDDKTGYPKGSTVTYGGCCWESKGDTFISYNDEGKQYQTDGKNAQGASVPVKSIHKAPGTSFLSDGKTPKWEIKDDICDRAEAGVLCDIGKISFGKGLTVTSSQSPGTAYQGGWKKGQEYNAGDIVNACDDQGQDCGYYKSRRNSNKGNKPVITTSWEKPVSPYLSQTTLSDSDGEVETRYEKTQIDNWWQLSPEPLQTDIVVSQEPQQSSNTIAIRAGYDPCDPCISGFDASESYGPDEDIQVVSYNGKVWKATGQYYDSSSYVKPGEEADTFQLNPWVEYRPKFCFTDEIEFGSGLFLDYCTTPATCNWPKDECEEGGSEEAAGNCGANCTDQQKSQPRLNVKTVGFSGVDCTGGAVDCHTPPCLEFASGDFIVERTTGSDGCEATKVCLNGWTISGATGTADCSGSGDAGGVKIEGVREIRLGTGLYFEDYATGTDCCSQSGNYVTIASTATLAVSGADCSGSGQVGNVTGVNYHTGDFCVELGDECDATIRTKGWTFSGTSGASDCSGSGDSEGVQIEGVKDIRLGSGLYFEDYSTGICCSGNYVTIGASATLSVSGADCNGSGQLGNVTGVIYHTGDFCVELGDECDATIRTKGWTFSGTSGASDCSGSGDSEGVQIEGVKDIRLGSGLYFEDYSTGICCSGNYVTIGASATLSVSGADCNGSAQLGNVTGVNYHTGDFCVELGDECDATIRTKGWTFSGTSGASDCSGSGDSEGVQIEGVKDIRLGSGLYFEDYSTGICCSGNYVTIGASATLSVSGADCNGSGQLGNVTGVIYHTGDFCVELGDECDATIRTKGWTFSGTSGASDCSGSGDSEGVQIEGVKDIRLGSGLYFEDYSTGICCSGNYVTIGASATLSVSGADCNGSAQLGNVTGVIYHTGDFCVELGDECDATIRTKGWTFSGTSGASDCSGSGDSEGVQIEGVKDIRLGSGLYFEDYSTGICCSGNYVTIGAASATFSVSGADCIGSAQLGNVTGVNYHTGDFCVELGDECDATIRTKGWTFSGTSGTTDCSGSGDTAGVQIEGVKDIRLGSGLYFEDYSDGICCSGNYVTIGAASATLSVSGADCNGSAQLGNVTGVNYHTGDFCVELGDECDATIRTKGWTFSGTSGTTDCSGSGDTAGVQIEGVKDIRLGSGLYFEDYSDGICCSGNYVTIGAASATFSVSGADCIGSGQLGNVTGVNYHTADFCVELGDECDATIRTKGWTFSGTSGTTGCSGSGDTSRVQIEGVKDIRLGSGLYFEDYSDGICCSGNYVTIGASSSVHIDGRDCSGEPQFGDVTDINYHSGDFCVGIDYGTCDGYIRTKGWTVKGFSGLDCSTETYSDWDSATQYEGGERVKDEGVCYLCTVRNKNDQPKDHSAPTAEAALRYWEIIPCEGVQGTPPLVEYQGVKEITFGNGLTVGGTSGVCCSGNRVTVSASTPTISGVDCSGSGFVGAVDSTLYHTGDFCVSVDTECEATVRTKGWKFAGTSGFLDCSGSGATSSATIEGVKDIRLGTGLYFEDYSTGICCSGNYVTIGAITSMGISGIDCEGEAVDCHTPRCIEFNPTDFVINKVEKESGCSSTQICSAGGFTLSGHTEKCHSGDSVDAGKLFNFVRDLRLGSGLYIEDHTQATGTGDSICCETSGYVTIGANILGITVSGNTGELCSGRAPAIYESVRNFRLGNGLYIEESNSHAGEDDCDPTGYVTLASDPFSGFRISGITGGTSCSGGVQQEGVEVFRVKDIRFGSGLYIENYGYTGAGECDADNHITLGATAYLKAAGYDCSGNHSSTTVTGINYHTGDFCVEGGDECDATIRTKGWTFSGTSGTTDCSGSGDTAGVQIEGVKDIRLGSGLYFEDYSNDPCCVGNYVKISAAPGCGTGCASSVSGYSAGGEVWAPSGCDQVLQVSGCSGLSTSISTGGVLSVCYTGCGASGWGPIFTDNDGMYPIGCDSVLQIYGCSGIATAVRSGSGGAYMEICYTGNSGSGCASSVSGYSAGGEVWAPSGCDQVLQVSGCSGISTSISTGGVLSVCYTGATGCGASVKEYWAGGEYWSPSGCEGVLQVSGCSGISTSISDGGVLSICYTGATGGGGTGTGCANSLSSVTAGGTTWNINGCDGALRVSGSGSTSVSIDGNGNLTIGSTTGGGGGGGGGCESGWGPIITDKDGMYPTDCNSALQIYGCSGITTAIREGTGAPYLEICYTGATGGGGTGTGCAYSVKEYRAGGEYWSPSDCEGVLQVSGCSGISTSISDSGVLSICYTGATGGGGTGTGCAYSVKEYWAGGEYWSPSDCEGVLHVSGCSGISTSISDGGVLSICYTGATGGGGTGTGCAYSVKEYRAGGEYWSPSDCEGVLQVSGCSGISTSISDGGVLSICYTGATGGGGTGTGCAYSVKEYWAGGEYWSPSDCEGVLHVSGCSGISTDISSGGVLSVCYTGARGCTLSGTTVGLTGDWVFANLVDYENGSTSGKTLKLDSFYNFNWDTYQTDLGCGRRGWESHNGIVISGENHDNQNKIDISTSAYSLIADDDDNFAIGENYAQHGSERLNWLRIKGSGDVYTRLLGGSPTGGSLGPTQDTTILIGSSGLSSLSVTGRNNCDPNEAYKTYTGVSGTTLNFGDGFLVSGAGDQVTIDQCCTAGISSGRGDVGSYGFGKIGNSYCEELIIKGRSGIQTVWDSNELYIGYTGAANSGLSSLSVTGRNNCDPNEAYKTYTGVSGTTLNFGDGFLVSGAGDQVTIDQCCTAGISSGRGDVGSYGFGKIGNSYCEELIIKGRSGIQTVWDSNELYIGYTGATGGGGGGGGAICPDAIENISSSDYSSTSSELTIDVVSAYADFNESCWVIGDRVCVHAENSAGTAIYLPATVSSFSTPNLELAGDFADHGGIKDYSPASSTIDLYHGPCAMSGNALEQTVTLCIGGVNQEGNVLFNPS